MDKRIVIKEGQVEIKARRLDVTLGIYEEGPIRYELHPTGFSSLQVEERDRRTNVFSLAYFHYIKTLMLPDEKKSKHALLYAPESQFAQKCNDLFLKLLHGEAYTILPAQPVLLEDLLKLDLQARTSGAYFNGEIGQAVEMYLKDKTLPEGMTLHKIPSFLDELEYPTAYSLHIDLW